VADLTFTCRGATVDRYAAIPTVVLSIRIEETTGTRIHAVALRCQLRLEPHRRRYDDAEAEALADLFGEPARWRDTLKPIQLATLAATVPGFTAGTDLDLAVPVTYDLEIAATKYLRGLREGTVPLLLLFSGTVFTEGPRGYAVEQIPWSKEAGYRMPVSVWQEAVERFFPHSAWLRLDLDTLAALRRFKSARALPTWDSTILALVRDHEVVEPGEPVR
jgi:Family of unknown function (DUF6084)